MSLCLLNITIGIIRVNTGDYFKIENGRPSGIFGEILDKFLGGPKEVRR